MEAENLSELSPSTSTSALRDSFMTPSKKSLTPCKQSETPSRKRKIIKLTFEEKLDELEKQKMV